MQIQGAQGPEDSPGDEHRTPGEERHGADREGRTGTGPSGGVYEWYTRGMELLGSGSPAAAMQLLQRAAGAEPSSRSIREALARAQFGARRFAEAADNFRWIVQENPAEDYALFGLGLSLSRLGDFEQAVEHLALAVAMRPENKDYVKALRHVRATLQARR
ncbi:tetratricopeptide repeat protein [Thermomonospora catenispora]|uniref:tetratricopeptide repeat protein n=1 Tax=Thermomonospora catenispora TaxID=2493090 RepID=UPI0013759833|nr:tetratricopeptide repeat protein [Thermomonospora catenispora]